MFRIKSLSVRNHYKFGNQDFNFCNFDQDTLNYYTVLIGPNGTGKSLILEIIINLFKLISNRQLELFDDYGSGFKIEFYYNSKLFFYSNLDGLTSTNINSKDDLPKKL
jgi:recombinational DNA repair ATPase RecF